MADWRDHLTPEEAQRLAELGTQAKAASKERRRIFDRARKRMNRERKNAGENSPANPQETAER